MIQKLYGSVDKVDERHRHRYEVNPEYVEKMEAKGLMFVGHDAEQKRMEVFELKDHPYYVGTQYHPEYLSRPLKPSPPFLGLILASVGRLSTYLSQGCKLSPRHSSDDSASEDEDRERLMMPKVEKLRINGNGYLHEINGIVDRSSSSAVSANSSDELVN